MATGNIKNFELKIGKTGLVIIVAGMSAFLCAAFLFGVDVGKNIDTYPDKIAALPQKALALVWQPAKIRAAQSAPDNKNGPGKTQTQENIDLTFYNDLTSKKGIPKERPVPEKQPVFSPPQNGEETVTGNFNIEAQSQPGSVNEKTKEKGEPKAKEVAPSVASNTQKFIIQAASLKDKTEANKMNKKIASLGFLSQVIKVEIPGKGIFFRVIVSGFENKVQAQEAALKISKKTGTSCIIKRVDNEAKKN
jgi:cell division protein FtsN